SFELDDFRSARRASIAYGNWVRSPLNQHVAISTRPGLALTELISRIAIPTSESAGGFDCARSWDTRWGSYIYYERCETGTHATCKGGPLNGCVWIRHSRCAISS